VTAVARPGADVLITGGGTAGHVYPALAIAEALVVRGHDRSRVLFVGARRGLERVLVPPSGFPMRLLPGRGLLRRMSWRNLVALGGLGIAFVEALGLVARLRPGVVVAVGGYGGVACGLAAAALGVPVVTVNVDAVPGAANRLVGRFAASSAVARPGSGLRHEVVTGVPVRDAALAVDRSPAGRGAARGALGIDAERSVVAFVGGSLGAARLNRAALGLRRILADRADLLVYHVSGARDLAALAAEVAAEPVGALEYRLVGFEERLPELFAAADLVVSRSGAMTVAELGAIGTPSVLVPLPGAPADHQRENARVLEQRGAAIVLDDADATADTLAALVSALLSDRRRLEEMERGARSGANRDAAASVAALIDDVAEAGRPRRNHRGAAA